MKKLLIILLALALLALPLTGFAAGKSSMFGPGSNAAPTESDSSEEDPNEAPVSAPQGDYYSNNGHSPDEIRAAMIDFLDSIDWNYEVDEEGVISFTMNIESTLDTLYYRIRFFDNGFTTYAYPNLYADESSMLNIAEYLHRANYGLRNGNFELDFNDGEIRYKSYVDCYNTLPGKDVLRRTISIPGDMFEIYGDGLVQVYGGYATPQEAIRWAESD